VLFWTYGTGQTAYPSRMQNKEHWKVLCDQAATEQDSKKLVKLVKEINRLLAEKDARLKAKISVAPPKSSPSEPV
jgi:hypothetical protein